MGGVGGITAVLLARNGIGHLKIADPDVYEPNNLNRQYGAGVSTLGKKKVDVISDILGDINPEISVQTYAEGVTDENLEDILCGVNVVIDAIEYSSSADKWMLYKKSRENGLYVLSSPISGFGSTIFCFDPKGPAVEEIFGFTDKNIHDYRIPSKVLMGMKFDYVPQDYFKRIETGFIPSNAVSVAVASAVVTVDVIKILISEERKKTPMFCSEFGEIDLIVVPKIKRYDLWDLEYCKVIDLEDEL